MSETKKDIMWRVWLVYIFICLFGLAIIFQVCKIKFVEKEYWSAKSDSLMLKAQTVKPLRGNIFSADGSLLCTSTPIYELRLDTRAPAFHSDDFNSKLDSLSSGLSKILLDKSAQEYKTILRKARRDKEGYFLLKKEVKFNQYRAIQKLPVFNKGRYKGGLIVIADTKRERIFNQLAERTIGYKNDNVMGVGIEGAFDSLLRGVSGQRMMQRVAGGIYKPVNDDNEIDPQDGMDVVTTIDLNIQDVAENALYKQLSLHNAPSGCAVLMEVKTGEIKAIANLTRGKDGNYHETLNYAVMMATEPGSTFKLATYIAAIDDGFIDIDDSVDVGNGSMVYNGHVIKDAHEGHGKISIQHAFESSSNVAAARTVLKYYLKNPKQFTEKLRSMHLDKRLGLQISGETKPLIKEPSQKDWSKTTLPVMSYGYEELLTPLQTLTFYNAVANGGKMVKPLLVKEVRKKGEVIRKYETEVLVDSICSQSTIAQARKMLEGVVLRGTATNLKFDTYTIAGKTGTAKMANDNKGYEYNDSVSVKYQASFCGYFPADKPLYSCIVMVYGLSPKFYYGNVVSGPVFKEIADKVYSTRVEMHKELQKDSLIVSKMPLPKNGSAAATRQALSSLGIQQKLPEVQWISFTKKENIIKAAEIKSKMNSVPDVMGMGLRDAVMILETNGMSVRAIGKGEVKKQSLNAGTPLIKGQQIIIELG